MVGERNRDGIQPRLFQPEGLRQLGRGYETRGSTPARVGARTSRLFSLTHRARMRGGHDRRLFPEQDRCYAVSVVINGAPVHGSLRTGPLNIATITVGELSHRWPGSLRVVNHYQVDIDGPEGLAFLLADLRGLWNCTVALVEENEGDSALDTTSHARSDLAEILMIAATDGAISIYEADGSQEYKDFEGQVVRAQVRRDLDGGLVLEAGARDDAYLLGLGVLLRFVGIGMPSVSRVA